MTQPDIPAEEPPGGPPGPAAAPRPDPGPSAAPPRTEPFIWPPTRGTPPGAASHPPFGQIPAGQTAARYTPAGQVTGQTAEEDAAPPPARPWPARSRRFWLITVAAVLGIAGLAASAAGLAAQILPRQFTAGQRQQIMEWETASRWRTWPAGKIFPAAVSYQLSGTNFDATSGLTLRAHRVGIAPQASCAAATDKALARVLAAGGCQTVLRATYTDATDSFAVTVGIAVMHGTAPSPASLPQGSSGLRPGVRAVPFRRTLTAGFGNRDRQLSGAARRGPYLVLYTVGYTDSRHYDHVSMDSYAAGEMNGVGDGIAGRIGSALGGPPPAPRCPGAPGC